MTLTKQERLPDFEVREYFNQVYTRNMQKYGMTPDSKSLYCHPAGNWSMEGWIDGPVTFIILDNGEKQYTGWSKFDNTGHYYEANGIYRALQKAVDKYVHDQTTSMLDNLIEGKWESGKKIDPFEDYDANGAAVAKERNDHAIHSDEDTERANYVHQGPVR